MNKRVAGILQRDGVGGTIVGSLLYYGMGIAQRLFNFCITLFGDHTQPQHQEPIEILEISRNFYKSTGLTIMCNKEALYWPAEHVEDSENDNCRQMSRGSCVST